jgi:hypothetical protein
VQRLGPVDHGLVSTRFFEQSLVDRMAEIAGEDGSLRLAPAVLVRGGASTADGKARTSGVQIAAVGAPAGGGPPWVDVPARSGIANGEVADALGVAAAAADEPTTAPAGRRAELLYTVAAALDTPRDATLARRGVSEVVSGDRFRLAGVERQAGFVSLFNLEGSQRVPRNLWLNLADLQRSVEQPKRINAIFVDDPRGDDDEAASDARVATLNRALRQAVTLEDYGLSLDRPAGGNGEAVLNARATFIDPPVLAAARAAAAELKVPLRETSVYLLNDVTVVPRSDGAAANAPATSAGGKSIHYAVAAGLNDLGETRLADGELALNAWAAEQLGAGVGDAIRLAYYRREAGGDLKVVQSEPLNVAAILPMAGLGADPSLTPAYKGLTDADSVSDWDPPEGVDIDKSKVTKADEDYWDAHRAAPKLFVNLPTARKLWGGAFGDVTSVRVPAERADDFARVLRETIDPAAMGMAFQPIRARQLEAASGSTDFAMLFVGFSFFLIVAAALLVAMLFRLNVEQRARQLGVMAAVGFGPKSLRGLALAEGMILALVRRRRRPGRRGGVHLAHGRGPAHVVARRRRHDGDAPLRRAADARDRPARQLVRRVARGAVGRVARRPHARGPAPRRRVERPRRPGDPRRRRPPGHVGRRGRGRRRAGPSPGGGGPARRRPGRVHGRRGAAVGVMPARALGPAPPPAAPGRGPRRGRVGRAARHAQRRPAHRPQRAVRGPDRLRRIHARHRRVAEDGRAQGHPQARVGRGRLPPDPAKRHPAHRRPQHARGARAGRHRPARRGTLEPRALRPDAHVGRPGRELP